MSSFVTMPSPLEFIKGVSAWTLPILSYVFLKFWYFWVILLILAIIKIAIERKIDRRIKNEKREEFVNNIAEGIKRSRK